MKQKDLSEKQWEEELVRRIENLEESNKKVNRMTRRDYITAGIIVVACLVAVAAGAFI
ncbi:MAG: hypothetical protein J6D02_07025 [Lachnospira sp.]|nr:hypothetical protein [Lachnospira sp.]